MQRYHDCPQVLREFLIYHENIKGQSPLTISEYYLDLRMFLRFIKLMRNDMPRSTEFPLPPGRESFRPSSLSINISPREPNSYKKIRWPIWNIRSFAKAFLNTLPWISLPRC